MRGTSPAVIVLAAFVSGCAGPSAMERVGGDLDALRAELRSLRSAVASATRSQEEARERDRAQVRAELEGLETRIRDSEARVQKSLAELDRLRTRLADIDARSTRPPEPTAAAPTPERVVPPARTESAEQMYAAALATLRRGQHGQAILEFLELVNRYPKHPLTGNAQYWIGEAYFAQRDYRQALMEFEKIVSQNGGGPKTPDALLKAGLCLEQLRDGRRAQLAWQRLVREHPNSEAAARARSLIKSPGMSAR
jgi:tol-pal system protein YbgF